MFERFDYRSNERLGNSNSVVTLGMLVDPEVRQLTNSGGRRNNPASGGVRLDVTIPSTHDRNGAGLFPRGVNLRWIDPAPVGYVQNGVIFVPIFNPSMFDRTHLGEVVTFRDRSAKIIGKVPEVTR